MTNPASPANLVFHNGQILTMDPASTIVSAVAVSGESIQAVGNDALPLAGPSTKVVDLRGRMFILGIIDIHAHMDREGLKEMFSTLAGCRSIGDILIVVREQVSAKNSGEWAVIVPVGDPPNYTDMPQSLTEGRCPTRWELDAVSPDNPVFSRHLDSMECATLGLHCQQHRALTCGHRPPHTVAGFNGDHRPKLRRRTDRDIH